MSRKTEPSIYIYYTKKLTPYKKFWSVSVDFASLIDQVDNRIHRIEHHDRLAKTV